MIVGNPKAHSIMLDAFSAHRRHGLSVQGLLPAWRASSPGQDVVREVFWRKALVEWCQVDPMTALHTVGDLERITRPAWAWEYHR